MALLGAGPYRETRDREEAVRAAREFLKLCILYYSKAKIVPMSSLCPHLCSFILIIHNITSYTYNLCHM